MIARGWATVELERAARELGDRLRPGAAFVEAADSELLAARCLVGELVDGPDGRWLVLLEPSTEGRISATLARHGEGWVASWEARGVPTADDRLGRQRPLDLERRATRSARPRAVAARRLGVRSASTRPDDRYHRPMTEPTAADQAFTLRAAVPEDAEAIAALFTDEGYPAGPSDIVERLGRFASPHSRVVVAERDGVLLGFVAFHAMPRFEHDDRIIRILALVVDAGARERGVGRALIAAAERAGTELDAAFIEITAGHHRPEARQLYETLGYDATVAAYLRKKL